MSKEKRDFGQTINNLDGTPVQIGVGVDPNTVALISQALNALPQDVRRQAFEAINKNLAKPLTLAVACVMALTAAYEDERNLAGGERLTRLQLAMRVNKAGMVKISTEERDLIKKCALKRFQDCLIAPTICLLLEGKVVEPEPEEEDAPKLAAV